MNSASILDYVNASPDESGFIKVAGGRVWYRSNGCGDGSTAPLLAIHGGPGFTHDYLLPLLQLSKDRAVILYDQLDCGKSDRPWKHANWNLDRFTGEIDCIRDALHLDQVHIFGNSWGCTIAVNYASRNPQGVRSLSLSGAFLNAERWLADSNEQRLQLPNKVQDVLDRFEKLGDFEHAEYRKAVEFFYKKHLCRIDPWPDCVGKALRDANQELYEYMWGPTEFIGRGPLKLLDLVPLLPGINVPALFIQGEFDGCTPNAAEEFAKAMPNAATYTVPNASHFAHIDNPDPFFGRLDQFLKLNDI